MGNAQSGSKVRGYNEEYGGSGRDTINIGQIQSHENHVGKRKLIVQATQDIYEYDAISKILSEVDVSEIEAKFREATMSELSIIDESNCLENKTIPTVFKWEGGGKDVFLSGSFNQWKSKIPMVRSKHNFYTIVELPKGDHQYKFIVDGAWKIDNKQTNATNENGAQNNVISVKTSDFDVLEALKADIANSKHSSSNTTSQQERSKSPSLVQETRYNETNDNDNQSLGSTPPGTYGQELPHKSMLAEMGSDNSTTPPLIPPQLLQVILNKETGLHSDPNLLPQPNHVMINHMYALSIKDGVIVLSAIARYRQKFVSTLMYKPI